MSNTILDDFVKAPNIGTHYLIYELENEAILRNGVLENKLHGVADWTDKILLGIGCGTGFWLENYAKTARKVIALNPIQSSSNMQKLGSKTSKI